MQFILIYPWLFLYNNYMQYQNNYIEGFQKLLLKYNDIDLHTWKAFTNFLSQKKHPKRICTLFVRSFWK